MSCRITERRGREPLFRGCLSEPGSVCRVREGSQRSERQTVLLLLHLKPRRWEKSDQSERDGSFSLG